MSDKGQPVINEVARMVMLTYGRMEDGKSPYWCYVAVKPTEYDRFMAAVNGGTLNLHTFPDDGYGEILVSGPGLYPPNNVTQAVATAFELPLSELFQGGDPKALIAKKIEELKASLASTGNKA